MELFIWLAKTADRPKAHCCFATFPPIFSRASIQLSHQNFTFHFTRTYFRWHHPPSAEKKKLSWNFQGLRGDKNSTGWKIFAARFSRLNRRFSTMFSYHKRCVSDACRIKLKFNGFVQNLIKIWTEINLGARSLPTLGLCHDKRYKGNCEEKFSCAPFYTRRAPDYVTLREKKSGKFSRIMGMGHNMIVSSTGSLAFTFYLCSFTWQSVFTSGRFFSWHFLSPARRFCSSFVPCFDGSGRESQVIL